MPDSKTTVGEPSPVTWMCIRRPLTRTRRPGGGKRRRSRHTPMAWYTAPGHHLQSECAQENRENRKCRLHGISGESKNTLVEWLSSPIARDRDSSSYH